jgi:hypothetical protein
VSQKPQRSAKGGSLFEGFRNQFLNVEPDTSRPTGRDTLSAVGCKRPSAGNGRPFEVTETGCRRLPFGDRRRWLPGQERRRDEQGREKETQEQV